MWTGWPATPMVVVNWCGHGQEFVPWPEKDGYWVLVPVIEEPLRELIDKDSTQSHSTRR
jgi:hypothetical protein